MVELTLHVEDLWCWTSAWSLQCELYCFYTAFVLYCTCACNHGYIIKMLSYTCHPCPLVFMLSKTFKFIWLSNLLTLSVRDVGYYRNVSSTLNWISTFYHTHVHFRLQIKKKWFNQVCTYLLLVLISLLDVLIYFYLIQIYLRVGLKTLYVIVYGL
jgi:hypothetical protein